MGADLELIITEHINKFKDGKIDSHYFSLWQRYVPTNAHCWVLPRVWKRKQTAEKWAKKVKEHNEKLGFEVKIIYRKSVTILKGQLCKRCGQRVAENDTFKLCYECDEELHPGIHEKMERDMRTLETIAKRAGE